MILENSSKISGSRTFSSACEAHLVQISAMQRGGESSVADPEPVGASTFLVGAGAGVKM